MMFKARLRRVLAGAFGAILAFAMAGTALAATTPGVSVVSEPSTVTVHVYNNNNADSSTTGSGAAVDTTDFGTAIEGATLSYYKVGELVQYTTNGETSLKYAVKEEAVEFLGLNVPSASSVTIGNDDYYLCDTDDLQDIIANKTSSGIRVEARDPQTPIVNLEDTDPTDGQGAVSVSGRSGLYLFIGNMMPSQVTTEVVPFFVSAPMPADGDWNTDIHVYPKVQTAGEISISKEVRYASSQDENDFTQSMSADAGTPLEYRITVTIPGDVKNLGSFSITDGLDSSLAVYDASNVEVKVEGAVQLAKGDDYELQLNAAAVRFELTSDGLNKFSSIQSGATTITITYETEIIDTAPLAAAIGQPATLSYKFNSASEWNSPKSVATVYTYGIDLTKTFRDDATYQDGAQFSLYRDQECENAVTVNGNGDGAYWVDSSSETTSMAVTKLNEADGTLTVKGLAAGTYYLKEVAAPGGYGKLQEPIKIKIAEGSGEPAEAIQKPVAYVNDASATIASFGNDKAGLVQLSVENQKLLFGFLPQTGDAGTLIATAAGIGMIALAIIFVAGRRSKSSAR